MLCVTAFRCSHCILLLACHITLTTRRRLVIGAFSCCMNPENGEQCSMLWVSMYAHENYKLPVKHHLSFQHKEPLRNRINGIRRYNIVVVYNRMAPNTRTCNRGPLIKHPNQISFISLLQKRRVQKRKCRAESSIIDKTNRIKAKKARG